ncbi:MAG: peptide ABC transporter substrate-binding protein [Clostridia bacterium]|nr:peptide ABC transporter substrate-binding protein [Clostridia bacterium]
MKRWIAGLLAALLLFALSACGGDKSADRSFFYPIASEPKSLDPQICGDADTAQVVGSLYEGLVRMGSDGSILPGVAGSMEVSDDGLVYTFHLRPNAKWHIISNFKDIYGKDCEKNLELPVTAEDFVFTFQRIFSASTGTPGAHTLYAIRNAKPVHEGKVTPLELGVHAADPYTLVIELEKPSSDFRTLLAQPICAPCNRFFFESTKGKYGLGLAYTMCNGPFYLHRWNVDTSLVLWRNPDYAGDAPVVPAAVSFMINNDRSGYARRVSDGTYDGAPIEPAYMPELDGSVHIENVPNIVRGLAFNCADEQLQNAYLRMALCSAFSHDTLEMPEKTAAQGILPAACRVSGEDYRTAAGRAEFPEENPDRALLFMQFALKEMQTNRVTVNIACTAEYETAMRRIIQRWQSVFGVTVAASTEVCEADELLRRQQKGDYQIAFVPVQAVSTSAVQSLYAFTGDGSAFGLDSPEYAGYMQAALTAPSPQSAAACCLKAESYLIRTGVFYPLFDDTSCFAFYAGAQNITLTPCGDMINFMSARKTD